ncbi:peptide chain release factor N(5)-glutamine methyltransferase [Halobacillus litoralis]|uniref:Release factor glutamine methyltransferase n=1 Tax=Halobacillus litoralis TaxID=45668 RepID=A0A410MF02_9BACI|nr:peptide chain release factor N(5)-glutamine methyltransferase [Halobacillus litoralis]QAS53293.1 peptide chain release factor N(5)-glutamine methyltransferase [Halobacillus litoralis]
MQPTFTTIREARRWASLFLQKHGREARVGDLLIENLLGWSQAKILAYEIEEFPLSQREDFVNQIHTHAETGVPVQHITGFAHFYGREFKVSPHVLIPRPETEELLLGVIEFIRSHNIDRPKIADIGTGSGVLSISAALEIPDSEVIAVDISEDALAVAARNAEAMQADIQFYQGDFLDPLKNHSIDIVISNPPYISHQEKSGMDDTVVNFDPELALFADEDGLAAYRIMLEQLSTFEKKPLCIAFEIGHQQGAAVEGMIRKLLPEYETEIRKDMNGKDRMVFGFHKELRVS